MFQQAQKLIYSVSYSHPITFMTTVVGVSTILGVVSLGILEYRMDQNKSSNGQMMMDEATSSNSTSTIFGASGGPPPRKRKTIITEEEARVRAMIENAKESTWREKMSNIAEAQGHFMLPPGHVSNPKKNMERSKFLHKIEQRKDEMMREQQKELERQSKRKLTTKFWKN